MCVCVSELKAHCVAFQCSPLLLRNPGHSKSDRCAFTRQAADNCNQIYFNQLWNANTFHLHTHKSRCLPHWSVLQCQLNRGSNLKGVLTVSVKLSLFIYFCIAIKSKFKHLAVLLVCFCFPPSFSFFLHGSVEVKLRHWNLCFTIKWCHYSR